MSLFERRSSMETWSTARPNDLDARASSPTGSERRKLSFNPVGSWVPNVAHEEPVAAFEVSKIKRIAQVAVACIYCLFAAGVVFGYAAIKPVLIEQGVYAERCTPKEIEEGVWVCYEQELRLNLMFTVAAVSTNVCALPVGTILDRYGPRVAGIIGCFLLAIGSALLAFAWDVRESVDLWIPGYFFLALGGPFIFISSFQLSNTFPKHSGTILALLTGAFDTSSAVFLIYRLIFQSTDGSFTTKRFFSIYLAVPALILVAQIFLMPSNSYKTVGELVQQAEDPSADSDSDLDNNPEARAQLRQERRESVVSEITELLGTKGAEEQQAQQQRVEATSGVWGVLHGKPALKQIMTPWFILIALFTIIQMTRINYFVATIRTQYSFLVGSGKAENINAFFDIALPLGGVVAVPFIGLVLDHTSTVFTLTLLVTIATTIGVLGVIPNTESAYANIILFVIYRPLYYTAVSDYSAKVFGFATFGKVYGLIICLAGLFNFSAQGLDALTHHAFNNNPIPVNIILLSTAFAVGVLLVGYVWYQSRSIERDDLEEEAEEAREVLMPGADASNTMREHGHQTYGAA
ncbi:MFS general substrate transporter [Aureobasidium sp. EXF-8845]|nr:MFS general substrate transporter [Aureobasidium sp. EXF-8845]KAI4849268.1 MFS general substrate transporter [Aureobasidium sp. EXF-8846]